MKPPVSRRKELAIIAAVGMAVIGGYYAALWFVWWVTL